jgi:hypothetical protein
VLVAESLAGALVTIAPPNTRMASDALIVIEPAWPEPVALALTRPPAAMSTWAPESGR